MKKVTWFKTATRRLEESPTQFFDGPVIVTVGTGLVGVEIEPPWLGLDSAEDGILGRLLAVADLEREFLRFKSHEKLMLTLSF